MAQRIDTDVAVVGAGLAGLFAARTLVAAGRDVVVLEARDRVGGRTWQHTFADGTGVEIGGQWIGPTQHRIARLVAELGLETFPTHDDGEHVLAVGGRCVRYRGRIPRVGPAMLLDMGQAQARFDRLARRVPLEAPWAADGADRWDGETFETWIRRNAKSRGARALLRLYAQAVFAAEASELSLLHALFYTHSGGNVDRLAGTRNGAQQDRVVGGTQQISIRLAEALGSRVVLGAPVRRIEHDGARVVVHGDGPEVRAARAVVALPPVLAGRIEYRPALPAARDQLTQKTPAGAVIKCNVVYDEPFWRRAGLSGQAAGGAGPVRVVFDNSPPSGTPGILVAFFEGADARRWGSASPEERRSVVLDVLVRFFGEQARRAVDYVEVDWAAEEWTRGCYGAHLAPGVWTQLGPALREPCGRLHWAGAETATVWSGYMDGALQSGERAAAEVLAELG